jgi:pimeloyl-ACP methyl ester carboxylesterase
MATLRGTPRIDSTMQLSDGRTLAYAQWGDESGPPVLLLHGGPGPRLFAVDVDAIAASAVRLITLDRPGLAMSDRLPLHGLASVATDVGELSDHLGIERFGVAGYSAGGTYALAIGALLPQRVSRIATMSAPGGPDVVGGFVASDPGRAFVAELARTDRSAAVDVVSAYFEQYVAAPDAFLDPATTPPEDMFLLDDDTERAEFIDRCVRRALVPGTAGIGDDTVAHFAPWDCDLADITAPTRVFHGRQDIWVPLADAEYLKDRIPTAALTVWEGAGHVGALLFFEDVLEWVVER